MADEKPRNEKGQFAPEWEAGEELVIPRTIRYEASEPVPHVKMLTRGMTFTVIEDTADRPPVDPVAKQLQESAAREIQAQLNSEDN